MMSIINKKLERKVNKHSRIHALAVAKHDSINSSVSQALNDNHVSDTEFELITREMQKYRQLKPDFRSHFAQKPTTSRQSDELDLKKIKDEIREEFRKKNRDVQHKFELTFEGKSRKFSLSLSKK